jgi:DNA-binding XRE family transcriptional regulator
MSDFENMKKPKKTFYGKRLKIVRFMHDMTTRSMAKELGISFQTVSNIETGKKLPSKVLEEGIKKIFELPSNFFTAPNLVIQFNGISISRIF